MILSALPLVMKTDVLVVEEVNVILQIIVGLQVEIVGILQSVEAI